MATGLRVLKTITVVLIFAPGLQTAGLLRL